MTLCTSCGPIFLSACWEVKSQPFLVAFQMLIKCYHSTSDAEHVCGLIASVKLLDTEARFVYDTLFERTKTNFGLFYQTEEK